MFDIQKKTVNGEAITIPPSGRAIQKEADATVGVRMDITPAIATEWLETRGNNRQVMDSTVEKYAMDMREGRWVFNGAPIQFDEEGKLLNGQHRLWAIIEAGFTMDAIVQWGIPREAQATIDAGAKWQTKDILYMAGEKNCVLLQATLRWVFRDDIGSILSSRGISNSKSLELLKKHPGVRRSVDFIAAVRGPLQPSVAAFLHYKVSQADQEKADEFFHRLADGVELKTTNPVYRLRERLISYMGHGRMHQVDALAIAIIAWNAFRAGKEMQALVWRKSGPAPQPFPTIEGAALATPKVQRPRGRPSKPKEPGATTAEPGRRREVGDGGITRQMGIMRPPGRSPCDIAKCTSRYSKSVLLRSKCSRYC